LFVAALAIPALVIAKSVETTSGVIYIQNKQFEDARKILLKAIEKNPKDADGHFYLAVAYSELDSVALAYKHFNKAKELEPKKARDAANNIASNYARHYKFGQDAFKQQDVQRAAREFKMATEADPTQSAGHYNLAVMYSRLAMADSTYDAQTLVEADEVMKLTQPSDPNYTNSLVLATSALAEMGRVDEAVARVQTLVEKDPTKYATIENIGNKLFDQQNWKGAEAILELAAEARAKTGADDFDVYNRIGVARFKMRGEDPTKVDGAIEAYTKALDLKPDDSATVFNLMVAHMFQKNWGDAASFGEKYVAMSPSDPLGWQSLGRCYTELGESDKATEALQRYQQLKG
jgi:tetratricopeptide (TPR) repeat protein